MRGASDESILQSASCTFSSSAAWRRALASARSRAKAVAPRRAMAHAASTTREVVEQLALALGEFTAPAVVENDLVPLQVGLAAGEGQSPDGRRRLRRAPQNGLDAGQQLLDRKGLDHVIVGAKTQPANSI